MLQKNVIAAHRNNSFLQYMSRHVFQKTAVVVCRGLTVGSAWDLFEIRLGSCWGCFGITLGSVGITLGSRAHYGFMLGSRSDHFGITLGITLGPPWVYFGIMLGVSDSQSVHVGITLGSLCDHFVMIL